MPDGKTLQIGTIHNLNQNFSKTFDITFEDPKGNTQYAFQTCYGISERSIAAVLSVHGDDNGLVLPPNIAPVQVIIIPILFKDKSKTVLEKCHKIAEQLMIAGIKVKIDESDLTPGNKYYKWEAKGVPLRLEIGPRDIKQKKIVCVRRDSFEKRIVSEENIAGTVNELLEEIQIDLSMAAQKIFHDNIHTATSLSIINKKMAEKNGITIIGWCGNMDCITKIEEATQCNILGNPLNYTGSPDTKDLEKCPVCSSPKKELLAIGRAY
jgi:prolyl-tRNA synthetase